MDSLFRVWVRLAPFAVLLPLVAISGCDDASGGAATTAPLGAYRDGDACHAHADAAACSGDAACGWVENAVACAPGEGCLAGFCSTLDACAVHKGAEACIADTACDWAELALGPACPSSDCSDNAGVCFSRGGGTGADCLCACPAFCPADAEDCGTCDCTCPPPDETHDGGSAGGGTCACAVAPCVPGQVCEPFDCVCEGGGGSGGGDECGGTCTCACPDCAPGDEDCAPCDCACGGDTIMGGGGMASPGEEVPALSCVCPECAPGDACPPCECSEPGGDPAMDPCFEHAEAEACLADTANACEWYGLGRPCIEGEECRSGVCQSPAPGGGGGAGGCVCACPACEPGTSCEPCDCDCTVGGGCAFPEGTSVPDEAAPPPAP